MPPFYFDTAKLPRLATAIPDQDFWVMKDNLRAFTKGVEYKVTRICQHYCIIINNNREEHFVLKDGWLEHFKIEKV